MEFFDDLINYGNTWAQLIKNNFKIFKLEAKLAQLSIVRFCISLIIISNLLLATWLSIIFILSYEIFSYTSNLLITGIFIFIINFIALSILVIYALIQIKNMQFQTSRKTMRSLVQKRIEHADQIFKKTNSNPE